jgi:tetratricopeptide (TPR) repeat protein
LRRSRIIILRIDNNLSNKLTTIRKKQNDQHEKYISFSRLNEGSFFKAKSLPSKTKKTELELLNRFIQDRNNLESYKNLARFYLNQNEYKNCRNILLEALTIDPEDKIISDLFITLYEKVKPEQISVN